MSSEIYPGVLAHSIEEYVTRIEQIEKSGASWVHIDVADGQFVPNITVMPHEVAGIATKLSMEAHLMAYRPERYFSDLTVAGVSRVLIHREAYKDLEECMQALKQAADYFNEVGLVLNPETEIEDYSQLHAHVIQCMSVEPGMSGQAFLEGTYERVKALKDQKLQSVISVDGGVGEENLTQLKAMGASRFIMNSHLFVTQDLSQSLNYFNGLVQGGI